MLFQVHITSVLETIVKTKIWRSIPSYFSQNMLMLSDSRGVLCRLHYWWGGQKNLLLTYKLNLG